MSLALILTACDSDKDDLQNYVEEVKARQQVDIPPIPVMKPYEKFSYTAAELRDPFVPTLWALIRAPDSTIHRVQVGNYMGMNHGQIIAISETYLTLKEIVPEGNGYNERETTVSVVEIN